MPGSGICKRMIIRSMPSIYFFKHLAKGLWVYWLVVNFICFKHRFLLKWPCLSTKALKEFAIVQSKCSYSSKSIRLSCRTYWYSDISQRKWSFYSASEHQRALAALLGTSRYILLNAYSLGVFLPDHFPLNPLFPKVVIKLMKFDVMGILFSSQLL
jgi:hypothetical protein